MAGESIAVAIYKLGMENQQYIAAAKAAAQAGDQLVAAQERIVTSEQKVGAASTLAANAVQRKVEANDKSIQAARKYAEAVAFVARAEEQNVGSAQLRQTLLDQEAEKLRRTTDALAAKAKAERDAAQAAKDEEAAAKNLARIEGEHALALKNTATALGVDRDALIAAANAGNRHASATLDMMNKIVGLNKSLQDGKISLTGHAKEVDLVQAAYRNQTAGIAAQEAQMRKSATVTGLARHEMINLSRQIQDVGVSLAGGQSPFRILIEQGSQIADIFVSSKATVKDFFSGIATSIRGLGSGAAALGIGAFITTLVVGAGAAAVAWASAQKDVELALLGIGRASGATAQRINEIAKAGATTFGLSISEAREFASILAQTGHIGVEQLRPMVDVGKNLATVLGVNSTEAAKMLGKALAEPGKGIEQLNQSLGQFDAATIRHVQNLVAQNRLLEAQKILMDGVTQATKNAGDAISNTSNFWTALGNKISNAATIVGEFVAKQTGMGQSSQQALEGLIAEYNALQRVIEVAGPDLREALQIKADDTLNNIGLINAAMERVGVTAEDTRRKLLSMADQKLVRDVSPEIAQFERLKNQAEGLRNLLQRIGETGGAGSPILEQMGQSLKQVELSAARAKQALQSSLTPAQQLTDQFELANLAITARTQQQRMLLAGRQQELALAGQNVSEEEKALAVERARYQAVLQIAQAHKDTMAALTDQLAVAQAVTEKDRLSAQFQADVNAGRREGLTLRQAEEQAALKQQIAEEQAQKQVREQNLRLAQQQEEAENKVAEAIRRQLDALERALIARGKELLQSGKTAANAAELAAKLNAIGEVASKATAGLPFGSGHGLRIFTAIDAAMMGLVLSMHQAAANINAVAIGEFAKQISSRGSKESIDAAIASIQSQMEQAANAAEEAARAQTEAADAAKAAFEAMVEARNEMSSEQVATQLLAGLTPQAVNAMIESNQILFGSSSERFQAQLDLYKRAGMSGAQTIADIRAGIIGEGAKPTELLEAIDSLTEAVDSNTAAQLGLSEFYTQQGDRLLGYRGFNVQRGGLGAFTGGTGTGGVGTGGMGGTAGGMGGIINPPLETGGPLPTGGTGGTGAGTLMQRILNGMIVEGYYDVNGNWVTTRVISIAPGMTTPSDTVGTPINRSVAPTGFPVTSVIGGSQIQTSGSLGSAYGRSFAEGGIVDRPQIAMFGEAGPEAFVPLKGGAIPVKLVGTNDNKPTTVVNINAPLVNFMAEPTRDEVKESAFQAGQMLRRIAVG